MDNNEDNELRAEFTDYMDAVDAWVEFWNPPEEVEIKRQAIELIVETTWWLEGHANG